MKDVYFLIIAIVTGVRWHLSVVLICISSMANDVGYLLTCFLASWHQEYSLFRDVI